MREKRELVYGVGINDYQGAVSAKGKCFNFYATWRAMLVRCYSDKYLKRCPTYQDCIVCDEWKSLSKFKKWHDEHYIEGWQLDKDLLSKGRKIYSPDTCCFLPSAINSYLTYRERAKGNLPIGVSYDKSRKAYFACIKHKNKSKYLGRSKKPEELFLLYKKEKEKEAKELAEEYKDRLDTRAYEALMEYETL